MSVQRQPLYVHPILQQSNRIKKVHLVCIHFEAAFKVVKNNKACPNVQYLIKTDSPRNVFIIIACILLQGIIEMNFVRLKSIYNNKIKFETNPIC